MSRLRLNEITHNGVAHEEEIWCLN